MEEIKIFFNLYNLLIIIYISMNSEITEGIFSVFYYDMQSKLV